jgi:pyruvate/2-oxoglutarate dehydrogenase complex dihydrolipoamide acyltransferase (E2) component
MKSFLSSLPLLVLLAACGEEKPTPAPVAESKPAASPAPAVAPAPANPAPAAPAPQAEKKVFWSAEMLHTEIKFHNPEYDGSGEFNMQEGQPIALSLRGAKIRGSARSPWTSAARPSSISAR